MVTPYWLQQSIASWSRLLRPGWIMVLMPNLQASSTASFQANGKNASLAKAAPFLSSPDFSSAICILFTRFGWPLPIPNIWLFLAKTIALLFISLQHFQAYNASCNCSDVQSLLVTSSRSFASSTLSSKSWTNQPALPICRNDWWDFAVCFASRMRKVFDFPFKISRPFGV